MLCFKVQRSWATIQELVLYDGFTFSDGNTRMWRTYGHVLTACTMLAYNATWCLQKTKRLQQMRLNHRKSGLTNEKIQRYNMTATKLKIHYTNWFCVVETYHCKMVKYNVQNCIYPIYCRTVTEMHATWQQYGQQSYAQTQTGHSLWLQVLWFMT